MSDWWKRGTNFPYDNPNFIKIINFYLFNCPVKLSNSNRVSHRAKIFEETEWKGNNLKTLLREMKRHITCVCLTNSDDVGERRKAVNGNEEFLVFIEDSSIKMTKSIFYAIRNAFAHGSFSVLDNNGHPIYYLESSKNEKIKSQIKLKEETLLRWIVLFNSTIAEVKKIKNDRKKNKLGK